MLSELKKYLLTSIFIIVTFVKLIAQPSGPPCTILPIIPCHPNVPSFNVNLSISNTFWVNDTAISRYGDPNN